MSYPQIMTLIRNIVDNARDMIKRCALTRAAKDDGNYQGVQCQSLGHVADIESATIYGVSYNAPVNSTGVMFNVQGNAENRVAFFNHTQTRFKNLQPWECQHGNQLTRSSIKYSNDKSIIIDAKGELIIITGGNATITVTGDVNLTATGNVTIKAPQITFDGDVTITQSLTVNGSMDGDGISLKNHVHDGVTTGGDNTGPPV